MEVSSGRPRIVVLVSHVRLGRSPSRLAVEVEAAARPFAAQVEVVVVDRSFESALDYARGLQRAGDVDLIVCAGATGAYLRKRLGRPLS